MRKLLVAFTSLAMAAGCSPETPATSEVAAGQNTPNTERSSDALAQIIGVASEQPVAVSPAAAMTQPLSVGDRTLDYPDDLQMTMLAYRLRGVEPPLEDWAGQDAVVRRADEFSRDTRLQEAIQRLRSVYNDTAGIGLIRMRTRATLSQYDPTRQGFYVSAFAPGTSWTFDAHEQVTVQFDNALAAHLWAVPQEEANVIFERNRRSRDVRIDILLRITGVEYRGNRTVIRTAVQDYTIHGSSSVGQIGAVDVRQN